MSTNRFASLYLDDEDDCTSSGPLAGTDGTLSPPLALPVTQSKVNQKPAFVPTHPRTWSKIDVSPDTIRDWNLEPTRKFRQPFSRGYAFLDDGGLKSSPLQTYAFDDESAPEKESVPPNSPVHEKKVQMIVCRRCGGEHWTQGCPTMNHRRTTNLMVDVQSQQEFPKLSDYQRPHTPPYPPDDGDYPTLAERMRRSIAKEIDAKATFTPIHPLETFEMISVIPMRTNLTGSFTLS